MGASATFAFNQGTPRGKQKTKRYARRQLHNLPAHKKREREEEDKKYERR